jgi:hypothetical protein
MKLPVNLLVQQTFRLRCRQSLRGFQASFAGLVFEDASIVSEPRSQQWTAQRGFWTNNHQIKSLVSYTQRACESKNASSDQSCKMKNFSDRTRCFHSGTILHSLRGEESLSILPSGVDTSSSQFATNRAAMQALVKKVEEEVRKVKLGGGQKAVERHRKKGKFLARERIDKLLDPGSPFLELSQVSDSQVQTSGKHHGGRQVQIVSCMGSWSRYP